jgi:hypothetical protein
VFSGHSCLLEHCIDVVCFYGSERPAIRKKLAENLETVMLLTGFYDLLPKVQFSQVARRPRGVNMKVRTVKSDCLQNPARCCNVSFAAAQTCSVPQRRFVPSLIDLGEFMKAFLAIAAGTAILLGTGAAYAASEGQGRYGGVWVSLLFSIVVFDLVMWVLSQMGKPLEGLEE